MATGAVNGFAPSSNGLGFDNAFPHEPVLSVTVPMYGKVTLGDAHNGLCGGMAYAVRDFFEQSTRPPAGGSQPPAEDTPLFRYLVSRLVDSFDLPGGVMKYFAWMNLPDGDDAIDIFGQRFVLRRGVLWLTIVQELPKIRADIDAGRLSPLGLVTVRSHSPADLGANHQVLAYRYTVDDDERLTLAIYDPNQDGTDDVTVSLSLRNPGSATTIDHTVAVPHPIRGFFRTRYASPDPGRLGSWR
jgi:hypothetical protein